MSLLVGEAHVRLRDPIGYIAKVGEHLDTLNLSHEALPDGRRVTFSVGQATLLAGDGLVALRAEAEGLEQLASLKNILIFQMERLTEGEALDVVWTGDGADLRELPNFRPLKVLRVADITPHMRRVTLTGDDIARFESESIHVRMVIPEPGSPPAWPTLGASGRPVWPEGAARPALRTYTLRRVDLASREIDVDFVAHGDAGPGTRFARRAVPGDPVGMIGPGGGGMRSADWNLFVGDETALPAIGRLLERLPPTARGLALIEVADEAERQDLTPPPGLELRWLYRNGIPAGQSAMLREAALALELPETASISAWAGCEFATFRALRTHWREVWKLDRTQHLAVAYWRQGVAETA